MLAYSIEQAWNLVDVYTKFHAAHNKWKKVLKLIQLAWKGGNSLVEKCQGLCSSLLDDVMLLLLDTDDVDDVERDAEFSSEVLELGEENEIADYFKESTQ